MSEYAVIGKSLPRVDAVDKVTGAAKYAADVNLPGQLWAKFLHSPHGHARIKSVDVSKAEALPGVIAVLHAGNIGGDATQETVDTVHGFRVSQSMFATDVVRYHGAKIAVVAAVTAEIAQDGVDVIEVEYELLPTVDTVEQGIQPGAVQIREEAKQVDAITDSPWADLGKWGNVAQETHFEAGDMEAGFAAADEIVENVYRVPRVHQTYIEPHACVAKVEPSGKINIWTSTQSIFAIRAGISGGLGIPQSRINVIGQTLGGGFGGKFGPVVHPYAVMLAQITGRPVKIVFTREEEMLDSGPAPGAVIWVKTGVKKDGTITARQAVGLWDCGHVPGASIGATGRISGVYSCQNIKYDAYAIHTNQPGTTAYRAPGAPQASYASESNLNAAAKAIGMDPIEFRLFNMVENGEQRVGDGKPLTHIAFKETLEAVAKDAGWNERTKGENEGWGVAVGEWTHGAGPGTAICSLGDDGILTVFSGTMDISGTDTGMAQIAAEVCHVPYENVKVVRGDTDSSPYATGSGGSVVLYSMGNATKRAAEALKDRIWKTAAEQLECDVDEVESVWEKDDAGQVTARLQLKGSPDDSVTYAEVAQMAMRTTGGPLVGSGTFASQPSHPVIGAQIVKVKVDPDTGVMEVPLLYGSVDCGKAINPAEVEGQMEGGALQGLSWAWMEEMQIQGGINRNTHLSDYRLPTSMDGPEIHSVLVEEPSAFGPFGVKGIGEPVIIPTLAALQNAVEDATGAHITDLPLTPERIYFALHGNGNGSG